MDQCTGCYSNPCICHDLIHKCSCGSGEYKYALYDARGIFCTYVCDKCVDERKKEFRLEIFEDSNYYADEPIEEE